MADRLEMLEDLGRGLGAAPVRALPAEEVRRRGDRLRLRRTALQALAAAAAVAVAVTGGVLSVDRPVASTGPTTGPSSATPASPATEHVLGHDGYRSLRLGMDADQVLATSDGAVAHVPTAGCAGIRLTDHAPRPHRVDGYLSARYGLVAVYARPDMATPEGIRPGSSFAQVEKAYPEGHLSADGYWIVPLGRGRAYEFGIEAHHRVGEMAVMRLRQDCFN